MVKEILIIITIIYQLMLCLMCYAQTDYFTPKHIFEFAEHLYKEGDYLRAAGEYQRYIFTTDSQESKDKILYKIGECYQLADMNEKSRCYYQCIINKFPRTNYYEKAHYQIASTYFNDSDYAASIEYIKNNMHAITTDEGSQRINQLLGFNYLYQKRWDTAHSHFVSLINKNTTGSADSLTHVLDSYAIMGTHIRYKSKIAAGMMSAFIPGTGKMYSGRFIDGVHSLLLTGLTVWQAYVSFEDNGTRSAKGWIYGTVSTILYFGNIYGSVANVRIYNNQLDDDIIHSINIDLTWR